MTKLTAPSKARKHHNKLVANNALGSKMFVMGRGREARPPKPLEKTASAPTLQRQSRAPHGWETQEHPGGQVSYRMRSAVEVYQEHFTGDLVRAAEDLVRDAELCTRANVICSRTYTGMPFAKSVSRSDLSTEQLDAQARFTWIMGRMDERFQAAVAFLVMGVRDERMGGGPRDFGGTASRYRDPTTKNAFTAGFLKAVLVRVKEGQLAYAAHVRWLKGQTKARATFPVTIEGPEPSRRQT